MRKLLIAFVIGVVAMALTACGGSSLTLNASEIAAVKGVEANIVSLQGPTTFTNQVVTGEVSGKDTALKGSPTYTLIFVTVIQHNADKSQNPVVIIVVLINGKVNFADVALPSGEFTYEPSN